MKFSSYKEDDIFFGRYIENQKVTLAMSSIAIGFIGS